MMKTNTFVYIDYFSFADEESEGRFYGHPLEGKVYKALKQGNKDSLVFKLPLDSADGSVGIVLEGLAHDGEGKWNHKVSEITDKNIIDFDISIDDLNLIEKEWIDILYPKPERKEEKEEKEENKEDKEEEVLYVDGVFRKISDCLNIILKNEELMFLTVAEIIEDISISYRSKTDPELKLDIINKINKLKERRK